MREGPLLPRSHLLRGMGQEGVGVAGCEGGWPRSAARGVANDHRAICLHRPDKSQPRTKVDCKSLERDQPLLQDHESQQREDS